MLLLLELSLMEDDEEDKGPFPVREGTDVSSEVETATVAIADGAEEAWKEAKSVRVLRKLRWGESRR